MTLPVQFIVSGMKNLLKVKFPILFLGWYFLAQMIAVNTALANDGEDPGKKLASQCKTCHGSYGIAQIPIAPNIAGEPEQYIINQLNAYRSDQRQHEMMSVVAKMLTDESIMHLAKWYSSQIISAKLNDDSADHSAISSCVECHGIDGLGVQENVPHLAGESVIYIDTQLKAFRSGKRNHKVMSKIASQLTDAQIRMISEWYSEINLEVINP